MCPRCRRMRNKGEELLPDAHADLEHGTTEQDEIRQVILGRSLVQFDDDDEDDNIEGAEYDDDNRRDGAAVDDCETEDQNVMMAEHLNRIATHNIAVPPLHLF